MATMGSLFDGIGGFPLAAIHNGITPVWASEIESFPIEVTKIRFPDMLHVGDITKLNGATLPPVDIVCGGSPCQDLSVAGKRAGLEGERSGLFMEQTRLVKEMRNADERRGIPAHLIRPRYMVWENVPGAFSSAEGEDFRAVIEEIIRIKDSTCNVPRPDGGRWQSAGIAILGNEFSLAWRVIDAQYWGVAQRRRRIFLVADFAGLTAPEILFKINAYWEYVTEKVFDYVINDRALSEPEEALKELERINRFLKEKVLDKLKAHNVIKLSKPEKVLPAFFNLLACHKLLCNENDRIRINYEICLTSQPDAEYIENFKKYEGIEAKWEVLPLIKDRLKGKNEAPDADIALYFISYGKEIDDTDIKHYKYAADKAKIVASWIEKYKCANFNGGIPLDMLVIIMQELIDNKKNGDKITNDYYGYNNKYRSLMTAVKNPETADAVVLQAWIKKLENRTAVNIGAFNLIQKKREIETTIYEIKSIIYSYRNLDDLEFVNSTISHFSARAITSRDLAMTIGNRFAEKVANNLKGKAKRMTNFYMWSEGINVMDMFREFLVDTQNIEDCVAEEVARQINEFYEEDDSIISRGMRVDFEVYVSEKYCKDFLLIYYIDKSKDTLTYQKFYEVCSDADAARMKSLGLEKFVITE